MSKTDKTEPSWLKVRELWAKGEVEIIHHCNGYNCNPQVWMPRSRTGQVHRYGDQYPCYVYANDTHSTSKVYGRRPSKATRKQLGFEGRNRALLRKLRYEWLHEPERDTIDSFYGAPQRHRQVCDPWDWD